MDRGKREMSSDSDWTRFLGEYRFRADEIWADFYQYAADGLSQVDIARNFGFGGESQPGQNISRWFRCLGFDGGETRGCLRDCAPNAESFISQYRREFEQNYWQQGSGFGRPPKFHGNKAVQEWKGAGCPGGLSAVPATAQFPFDNPFPAPQNQFQGQFSQPEPPQMSLSDSRSNYDESPTAVGSFLGSLANRLSLDSDTEKPQQAKKPTNPVPIMVVYFIVSVILFVQTQWFRGIWEVIAFPSLVVFVIWIIVYQLRKRYR